MKCQTIFPACLLLLWTLTAPVSCDVPAASIEVQTVSDGIVLKCAGGKGKVTKSDGSDVPDGKVESMDDNSGEYTCEVPATTEAESPTELKIYVKFRSCDNCIELDEAAIAGLVVGNVVATIVIGVSVYLVAQTRISPDTSHKKSSDKQRLVQNEARSRGNDDQYQPLSYNRGGKDEYDVLSNRR